MRKESARLRSRAAVAAAVVASLLIVLAGPVAAAILNQGPGSSTTSQSFTTGAGAVSVYANLSSSDDGTGNCVESLFDWGVTSGHYDARLVRVCFNSGSYSRASWVNSFPAGSPTGVIKARGCLYSGVQSVPPTGGNRHSCESDVGSNSAPCGDGAAACYVKKSSAIYGFCTSNPTTTSC